MEKTQQLLEMTDSGNQSTVKLLICDLKNLHKVVLFKEYNNKIFGSTVALGYMHCHDRYEMEMEVRT